MLLCSRLLSRDRRFLVDVVPRRGSGTVPPGPLLKWLGMRDIVPKMDWIRRMSMILGFAGVWMPVRDGMTVLMLTGGYVGGILALLMRWRWDGSRGRLVGY